MALTKRSVVANARKLDQLAGDFEDRIHVGRVDMHREIGVELPQLKPRSGPL